MDMWEIYLNQRCTESLPYLCFASTLDYQEQGWSVKTSRGAWVQETASDEEAQILSSVLLESFSFDAIRVIRRAKPINKMTQKESDICEWMPHHTKPSKPTTNTWVLTIFTILVF